MLRRLLAGAAIAGAAVSVAAIPAHATEPDPGPLAGQITAHRCRVGGGRPIFTPFQQIGPVTTGFCLGGEYTLARVTHPGTAPGSGLLS